MICNGARPWGHYIKKKKKISEDSRRNPSEKNFEDWMGSRVNIHSERTKTFRVVRSREVAHYLVARRYQNFAISEIKGFEVLHNRSPEVAKCKITT
jgi:hypothetical protein